MAEQLTALEKELDGEAMRTQLVINLDGASRIQAGDRAKIWMDTSKMHLFDPETQDNLTVDLANAGRIPSREEEQAAASA